MKKLPYGISNYERIVRDGYYYVDKTKYIEKLEELPDVNIIYLRPRKFGKTLFTSVIENYYDILKKDKFEQLFSQTYIGKKPTNLKNSYHILRFNFSGINTETEETTMKGFRKRVQAAIKFFSDKYGIRLTISETDEPENILDSLIKEFEMQKKDEKIYVIIDEYDHFANELLGFKENEFKTLVSKNGRVRKWYEVLKQGTETVVDRIFITGVAPITLDSLTSGFNIGTDITKDPRFNEMTGFSKEELIELMKEQNLSEQEIENLLPIMKQNYNGYKFCIEPEQKIYNSNMCLYFMNQYISFDKIPNDLLDGNIASDYSKLGKMLELCQCENRLDIMQKTIAGEAITSELTKKFNPEIGFGETELISMLYYMGYLTIEGDDFGESLLQIPNNAMKELYAKYFVSIMSEQANFAITDKYVIMQKEIARDGKIDTLVEVLQKYLNNLSNRDFIKFDEKYIKLLFYSIAMNLKLYYTKSEMEVHRKYPDILLIPRDRQKGYNAIMVEFKYLKKGEEDRLEEMQEQARKQIEEYCSFDEIKDIEKMNKYTIVAINDKLYVEKI